MKQIFLFLFLWISVPGITGQTQNTDSLVNVLETGKNEPAEEIELCKNISYEYVNNDLDKSILYAKRGIAIAEKEKDKLNASKLYNTLSFAYHYKANFDSAQICLDKALNFAIEAGNAIREINVLSTFGTLFKDQEKFQLAIDYYVKALKRSDEVDYPAIRGVILGNMGIIHHCLKNNERAMVYLEQAKEIAEKDNDLYVKMGVLHAMGTCYFDDENYEQAINYTQQAYDISISINDKRYQAMSLGNLALFFEKGFKDYDKALEYARKGLQAAEEIGSLHEIISCWNTLSNIYREKQMYKESEQAALNGWNADSTSLMEATNLALNITIANINLENKKKAVEYLWKYHHLRDQYSEKNSYDALMDMEVKYETEKKEMRIASLEKERQLYVWLGIAGAILAFALGIVLWLIIRNTRKERQLIAAKAVQDGEMGERARIAEDLHDRLGGSLSAVKIELRNAESLQNVGDKLDECIKEIREITHNLMPRSLRSFGMKTALEDFVAQFPHVHFHFFGEEKRIRERLEFIIYCCANELVTNSIRYSNAKNINVQLIQSEKHVSLIVQDDGCGFDEKVATTGIGLKNIRDRVASCNGKLDIATSPDKGTETIIELKVEL